MGLDAIAAFTQAIDVMGDVIGDEPLTRYTLISFRAEHERHVRELLPLVPATEDERRTPTGLIVDPARFRAASSTTAVLRLLKFDAEVIARRHQAILSHHGTRLGSGVFDAVRTHTNDCLRHRAWIAARVDAFIRTLPGEALEQLPRSSPAARDSDGIVRTRRSTPEGTRPSRW